MYVCVRFCLSDFSLSFHLCGIADERKYKCHLCPYAAKCRANLNQHLTIHSVKLVSTDTEHLVNAVTGESNDRKSCSFYYRYSTCWHIATPHTNGKSPSAHIQPRPLKLTERLSPSLQVCVYLFSRLCVCLSALCCSCHVCGFQTELNAQFVSHMSLHVDKEQWMFSLCCTSCDYVSVDESDIKSHIAAEHSGKRRTRNPTTSHQ